jgi:hypothetical protein
MSHRTAEEAVEGLGEFAPDLAGLVDVDLFEKCLVDLAAQLGPGLEVLGVAPEDDSKPLRPIEQHADTNQNGAPSRTNVHRPGGGARDNRCDLSRY